MKLSQAKFLSDNGKWTVGNKLIDTRDLTNDELMTVVQFVGEQLAGCSELDRKQWMTIRNRFQSVAERRGLRPIKLCHCGEPALYTVSDQGYCKRHKEEAQAAQKHQAKEELKKADRFEEVYYQYHGRRRQRGF